MTLDSGNVTITPGAGIYAKVAPEGLISKMAPAIPVDEKIKVWDALTRNGLAVGIMAAFLLVNAFTLSVLVWLGREDQHDLMLKLVHPDERLVNKDVIMSLLGASTVQLGSIAVIMAKYVFNPAVDAAA